MLVAVRGPGRTNYAGACVELSAGGVAQLVRYDRETDSLQYLLDMADAADDPRDSGRCTQCKIHYSLAGSRADGVLYIATHVSATPYDEPPLLVWRYLHDPTRWYRGSAIVAYDTSAGEVLWTDTLIPKEGSRCTALDHDRGVLYSVSCPRDHLIAFDLRVRERRDLGRIGSVNTQSLILDRRGRVWIARDDGRFLRYDPAPDRVEVTSVRLPFDPSFQTGWHSVLYDATPAADGESVFAVTWIGCSRLLRLWPEEDRIEDLGPLTQSPDPSLPADTFRDHSGGIALGPDGNLYYAATRLEKRLEGVVWRLDPQTLERDEVCTLDRHYVSRAAFDEAGDLFLGSVGGAPAGIYRVPLGLGPGAPVRMWG